MDRIKIAIVGLGFGRNILHDIVDGGGRPYLQTVGVCDLDTDKAAAEAARYGIHAYASLDEILADAAVDAVGLFTPPVGRAALIRKIVRAGKHVVTTKPFERDAAETLAVLREARDLGRVVTLNSPSPTLPPDLAQVEAWRREHDLGRPIAARFDIWGSYHEQADGSWYDDPERCPVAPIFRLGVYLINDAVRIFGEAAEVQVLSSRIRTGRPTPDNAQMNILFRSGALANIFATFCVDDSDNHRNAMTVNFERGTIYRNCGPELNTVRADTSMALVHKAGSAREVRRADFPGYNLHHVYQWDIVARLVRGDRSLITTTPETVAAGIRILEAMVLAETNGGCAAVKPVE
jgi:predicted dehydrogenase